MKYSYVGYTSSNTVVKGNIDAENNTIAEQMLEKMGYTIVELGPFSRFLPETGQLFKRGVDTQELVVFTRQLALLLESGVGIIKSLEIFQTQTKDRALKNVLTEVIADIRKGESLSVALEKHSNIFSKIYCRMVAIGERGGGLETILKNLADLIEKQTSTIKKLRSAMIYPIIVFMVAIVVAVITFTFLLPTITKLFSALGGQLPLQTRMLIWLVDAFSQYGLYLLLVLVAAGIAIFMYVRTTDGRYLWDKLKLRIPLLGRIIWLNELSRLCRSLALLYSSGVPLAEGVLLAAESSKNSVLVGAINDIHNDMINGEGLAGPMSKNSIFLPLLVEMTKVGEETGHLETSLSTVSDSFEVEADRRTQNMLTMIEPVMTIIVGLFVAWLALSVIGPIYSSLGLVAK